MAPTKSSRAISKQGTSVTADHSTMIPMARKGLTRRTAKNIQDQNIGIIQTRGKRKADASPLKNEKIKRSALGNLTNNVQMLSMTQSGTSSSAGTGTKGTQHPEEEAKKQISRKKDNSHHNLFKEVQNIQIGSGSGQEAVVVAGVAHTRQQNHQQLPPHHAQAQQHQHKITTRATARNAQNTKVLGDQANKITNTNDGGGGSVPAAKHLKKREAEIVPAAPAAPPAVVAPAPAKLSLKPVRRISNEFNKTEESLYMSALEDISSSESLRFSGNFEAAKRRSALLQLENTVKTEEKKLNVVDGAKGALAALTDNAVDGDKGIAAEKATCAVATVPEGVEDFDKANWNDPFQVSNYAMDIFNYLKERESQFPIVDYMEKQVNLSKWMRSLLVDWMVEVQETFELNHETLYLAVKIVDLFLSRDVINKDKLQLLGAAALFIACKFDERTPPLIEDFLYICDGAYKHNELVHMEMKTLRIIDYDLGIPLSYRFLRRYARCSKVTMSTLTLARFILELSLMDYATIRFSDSQLACAVLFMALRLNGHETPWTPTLEYYTGFKLADFAEMVPVLNAGLHRKPKSTIKTIRNKYSHKIFHEVAKVPLMTTEELFKNNLDLNFSMSLVTEDCFNTATTNST